MLKRFLFLIQQKQIQQKDVYLVFFSFSSSQKVMFIIRLWNKEVKFNQWNLVNSFFVGNFSNSVTFYLDIYSEYKHSTLLLIIDSAYRQLVAIAVINKLKCNQSQFCKNWVITLPYLQTHLLVFSCKRSRFRSSSNYYLSMIHKFNCLYKIRFSCQI